MKQKTAFVAVLMLASFGLQLGIAQTHSSIAITSQAKTLTVAGAPYSYQVTVKSSRSADTIHFRLTRGPAGMKVDSLSGLISWNPPNPGLFGVEVVAYNTRNDKASQSFSLKVVAFLGTIKGVIKDDSGVVVRGAHVMLVSQSSRPMNAPGIGAETDSLGRYTIANVDSGKYFAQATPGFDMRMSVIPKPIYMPVWFVDSPTMSGATAIPVTNSSAVTANFTFHRFVPPVPAVISGNVKDSSGKPIREATVVVFLPPPAPISAVMNADPLRELLSTIGLNESSIGCFPFFSSTGRSDSAGNYKVKVVAGGPYLVAAFAKNFALQYYKGKSNALEADKLSLTKDSAGVNFALAILPKITTKVSGSVRDSAGTGIVSRVILYPTKRLLPPLPPFQVNVARTVHTDSLGHFVFEGVPDGAYILQAAPFAGYLPSFYKLNSCGVTDSRKMDTIFVKGSDITNVNICVKKGNVHGGGKISGKVHSGDNVVLPGVVVLAQSTSLSELRSYSLTDANGLYEIADLDAGTYDVSVDKVGFRALPSVTKTLDFQNGIFSAQADFQMGSPTLVGAEEGAVLTGFSLSQNYPNPFNPSTQIIFNLAKPAFTTLKVYNMLGQEVQTLVSENMPPGIHSVEFSAVKEGTGELPSGVYVYQIRSGSFSFARKMLLLK